MSQKSASVMPIANGLAPDPEYQGPKVARLNVALGAGVERALNLLDVITAEAIDTLQSIYVDNRAGANALKFKSSSVMIEMEVPAGCEAVLPFFMSPGDSILIVSRADAGSVVIGLFNVPFPAIVWPQPVTVSGGVSITGTVDVEIVPGTVATKTSVAAAVVDTALLAANAARKGASVFNDSATATLYLSLGSDAASLTSYTVKLLPGQFYETLDGFTGAIRGIWSAAVGDARITEQT